ncbi:MAG: sterol desaturase family protein [Flavobacteriales bacterium]|jgi:sterol desaturase/sphingolipid hydroxylase (fatty acid hydroxylase superfamily)|nr:sterol desaturase family protein [Flavobacteriales bacterium]
MDYIALSIPLFFALMGIELAWSAWSGRRVYRFKDFVTNISCGIGSQVVGAFSKTVIFAIYVWTYEHLRLFTLPPSALTVVVTFLLVDLLYYWFHRLSHQVNFLWAAHIVHHQSEDYNLSVALRQSWWQGLFSFWFYIPIAVLGVDPLTIVTVAAFVTLYQFWIHTEALGRLGPLEWVLNTPSHHRVHHGSDPKYIDRNHAGTLIIWDKLFGTYQGEEETPVYGITTPLASWDPVYANFHYWGDLLRWAARTPRWGDRIRIFLKPPGWLPADLGGYQGPVAKDRSTYRKFDTHIASRTTGYVVTQFILLLVTTTLFLFRQSDLGSLRSAVLAGVIVLWVMDLGLLLEGKRWALWPELLRIAVFTAVAWSAANLWQQPGMALVVLILGVVSLAHLFWAVGREQHAYLERTKA